MHEAHLAPVNEFKGIGTPLVIGCRYAGSIGYSTLMENRASDSLVWSGKLRVRGCAKSDPSRVAVIEHVPPCCFNRP